MTTEPSPEEQFLSLLVRLRQQLILAHWHRNIIKYVSNLSSDYSFELDQLPYFFRLTFHANVFSTLVRLHTFFDRSNNLSMHSFFDFVEKNITIMSDEAYCNRLRLKGTDAEQLQRLLKERLQITNELVQEHKAKIFGLPSKNLTIWRNNLLAHVNLNAVLEQKDYGKKYPINWTEIDTIFEELFHILNLYSIAYDASGFSWGSEHDYEIKYILETLRDEHKRRLKNMQE